MSGGFRDLRVWQLATELVVDVYRLTKVFPSSELYGLTNQMRRAAVSIPSNIAEGRSRDHLAEYLHHLSIAQGSLAELETQLEIAHRLDYLPADTFQATLDRVWNVARALHALRSTLKRRLEARRPAAPAPPLTPKTQNPTPSR